MISEKISLYFSWNEALWLPKWGRLATEQDGLNDEIRANLIEMFRKMDAIRAHFNMPIFVHCAYRPPKYNELVGGSMRSAHMQGKAVDWSIKGMTSLACRNQIVTYDLLNSLNIRMERDTVGWVHLDNNYLGVGDRYFYP